MKLLPLYRAILSTASIVVDDEGLLSLKVGDKRAPCLLDGKRLVLPTREHQQNPQNVVIFHPLSEHAWRNESPVMECFRGALNVNLNRIISSIALELLNIVANQEQYASKMSPEQSELLSVVKQADQKTVKGATKAFAALISAMGLGNKDKCIIHTYLKRKGTVGDKVYHRTLIVTSPLYEELEKEGKQVFGVTLSTKERNVIKEMLKFVVPGIDKPHSFDKGSNSDIGPFLDAMMRGLMDIASNINNLVQTYEPFLENKGKEYLYNDEWLEVFENLEQLTPEIRLIPMQAGNDGVAGAVALPPPNTTPFVQHQPQHVQHPYQAQQVSAPYIQPQHAPEPVRTASGLADFGATMRNNPQLAAAAGYGTPSGFGVQAPPLVGPMASRQQRPRWDVIQPPTHQQGMQYIQPYPAQQGFPQGGSLGGI